MSSPPRRRPARTTPKPPQTVRLSTRRPADPAEILLQERTSSSKERGGGPAGVAWEIFAAGELAGEVFINRMSEGANVGRAFIEIYLNRKNQGRKIGRVAYRLAVEQSPYDEVFAIMRKSNVASWRAAEEAGFVDVILPGNRQKAMVWHRT